MRRTFMDRVCFLAISFVLMLVSISTAWLPSGAGGTQLSAEAEETTVPPEDLRALYTGAVEPLGEEQQALYDSTVKTLLKEDLWTARDMYDAGHYLMVPMHYAFRAEDEEAVQLFADFFARFTDDVSGEDVYRFQDGTVLNRLHFFYLCTQFMNLCAANGYGALIPEALPGMAQAFAGDYLLFHVANWETEPTVIEHMRQVIAGKEYSRSYYSVIEGLDQFTLAILCDLKCLYTMQGTEYDEVLDTAADLSYQIFRSAILNRETECGGWLLQPGAWSDHPDFSYSGNESVYEGIQPKICEDIPWDSSHFHQMPLLLHSYQSAQSDEDRRDLFALRREQLANQLVNYVLQNVDGHWLTTTFMDGTNGVYRYSYNTEGVGIEGYALSGTFLLGWWSLLEDSRVTEVYRDILKTFPMEGNRSNPYFDYATVREQNPFFDMDTAFDNGMFECIVACASKLL